MFPIKTNAIVGVRERERARACAKESRIAPRQRVAGWLRSVGFFKLYVSFAECSLFYRALLQKRPIILRSLLIEATPYLL